MSDLVVRTAAAAAEGPKLDSLSTGQLLVLVLDINPNQPFFCRQPRRLVETLDRFLALANAHLLLHPHNRVAAIGASAFGCSFLFPEPNSGIDGETSTIRQRDGQFEGFYQIESSVRTRVTAILRDEISRTSVSSDSLLSGALCMALAFINRTKMETPPGQIPLTSRILAMSASGDSPTQYMNFMNVFFSAQKLGVLIDSCLLDSDCGLLQQAADITGGMYRKVEESQFPSLLQFLTWLFLPDASLRSMLSLPAMDKVDYRAACFCHRQMIDNGFVCSVCLSIFCKFSPICTTCNTVFKMPGAHSTPRKKKVPRN